MNNKNILKHILILCAFSVFPLLFFVGCGFDCTEPIVCSSTYIDNDGNVYTEYVDPNSDIIVTADTIDIKGCGGCFDCAGGCLFPDKISLTNVEGEYESNKIVFHGCLNYFTTTDGCGCNVEKIDSMYYYKDLDNTVFACDSQGCNKSFGCVNGCMACNSDKIELDNLFHWR